MGCLHVYHVFKLSIFTRVCENAFTHLYSYIPTYTHPHKHSCIHIHAHIRTLRLMPERAHKLYALQEVHDLVFKKEEDWIANLRALVKRTMLHKNQPLRSSL